MTTPISTVLDLLPSARKTAAGYEACCPAHADNVASLSVSEGKDGRVLLHCHAGCILDDILMALGLTATDLFPPKAAKKQIVATYEYTDEQGIVLYQAVRYLPKTFKRRRPDGYGDWIWNLTGVRRVLYRLPLLTALKSYAVFVTEGEKDADALLNLGLLATTNIGGAGEWRPEYSRQLQGRDVVILPDNDTAGVQHAQGVAAALDGIAATVKVLALPGLPAKGDVSDWLSAGGDKAALEGLVFATSPWGQGAAPPGIPAGPTQHRRLTDLGNAERLVDRYGDRLRYCHPWNVWLWYDGTRWQRDQHGAAMRMAKETVRQIYVEGNNEPDADTSKEIVSWAIRSESRDRISSLLVLAQSELAIVPAEMDVDPWLFNVQNGTLDLRTGTLRRHCPGDYLTKLSPVPYDAIADAPLWRAFIDRVLAGDAALIGFVQRSVGYAMTGSVREECLFLLHGKGQNGKSKLIGAINSAMGDYAATSAPDLLMSKRGDGNHPTELADLFGRRFVSDTEPADQRRFDESLLKRLTGGDRVKARGMRENFWEFEPTHKFFVAANHKPVIKGTDLGIWRRIHLIPFNVTIPPAERDQHLAEKLYAERPGILRWMLDGCLSWQDTGLLPPPEVCSATEMYRADMDLFAEFIADCCAIRAYARVTAKAIYTAYTIWCAENGEHAQTQNAFGHSLTERGYQRVRTRTGIVWHGIGLLASDQQSVPDAANGVNLPGPVHHRDPNSGIAGFPAEATPGSFVHARAQEEPLREPSTWKSGYVENGVTEVHPPQRFTPSADGGFDRNQPDDTTPVPPFDPASMQMPLRGRAVVDRGLFQSLLDDGLSRDEALRRAQVGATRVTPWEDGDDADDGR